MYLVKKNNNTVEVEDILYADNFPIVFYVNFMLLPA